MACENNEILENDEENFNFNLSLEERFSKVDSSEWIYHLPTEEIVTYTGVEAVKRRALQFAAAAWMPQGRTIPRVNGEYSPGVLYTGIPYSLAIMTDTHVGTQSSIYTFMTAVDNPRSVLYTEDLRKSPYNGFDCAPYYGSTCSNSVMYALGIEAPFYTYMIPSIKGMKRTKDQNPEDVESCDVLLKSGHVVMVYDVQRDIDNNIQCIKVFETTSVGEYATWIREFTIADFKEWWNNGKYVRYQYAFLPDVTYTSTTFVPMAGEERLHNYRPLEICTSLGDCVTYWEGQKVKIIPVEEGYKTICVFKDDSLYHEQLIKYPETVLTDLPCGQYKVYLSDANGYFGSHYTSFEVFAAEVKGTKDEKIRISFSSEQATPRYICICNYKHDPKNYYLISDADRVRGYFEMPAFEGDRSTHYKVYFKGKYNAIATELKEF